MSSSKRLQPAVEMVQQKAEDAARKVVACQQKVKDRELQLDELVEYRKDYTNSLQHKSRAGLNATRMNDYNVFMARLNHAIEQQEIILESANNELSACKRTWLELQQRAKALESVVAGYQKTERQEQSRREQKESDEYARRIIRTVAS